LLPVGPPPPEAPTGSLGAPPSPPLFKRGGGWAEPKGFRGQGPPRDSFAVRVYGGEAPSRAADLPGPPVFTGGRFYRGKEGV
jgi:hypothetical protein